MVGLIWRDVNVFASNICKRKLDFVHYLETFLCWWATFGDVNIFAATFGDVNVFVGNISRNECFSGPNLEMKQCEQSTLKLHLYSNLQHNSMTILWIILADSDRYLEHERETIGTIKVMDISGERQNWNYSFVHLFF